jgi:hypothetical protein
MNEMKEFDRDSAREELKTVLHDLEAAHGLHATDCPDEYNEALRDGLDANAARKCVQEATRVLDFSTSIAAVGGLIKALGD